MPVSHASLAHASLVLVAALLTLPFLQPLHRFPLTSFYSEWLAFALGIAACALLMSRGAWKTAALPATAFAPLALAALILVQTAAGMVPYAAHALTAVLYLAWAALLMLLAAALRREFGSTTITVVMAWSLLAGACAGAIVGFLQHYEFATILDPVIARKTHAAVFGNLGQPNHYATHLTLGLISAGYLWATGRMSAVVAFAVGATLLLMLGVSGSRSVWVYLVIGFVLAVWLRARHAGAPARRLAAAAAAALVAFALAQWLATLPLFAAAGGVVTSTQKLFAGAAGITDRLQLWREAWLMFTGAPWLGQGWGQFASHHYAFHAAHDVSVAAGLFGHAHNIVLQLLAETGIAGAACVIAGAVIWLAGVARRPFDPEAWWLLAILGVLGAHSMLEYPLWYAYFLAAAALALGLGESRHWQLSARAARLAASGFVVIGALHVATALPAYRDFERLFTSPADGLSDQQLAAILARAQGDTLFEPYGDLAVAYVMTVDPTNLAVKLALLDRVARFIPVEIVVYRRAILRALNGEAAAAADELAKAMRAYPGALPEFQALLADMAPRHPRELMPLLKLASAESARQAAPRPAP